MDHRFTETLLTATLAGLILCFSGCGEERTAETRSEFALTLIADPGQSPSFDPPDRALEEAGPKEAPHKTDHGQPETAKGYAKNKTKDFVSLNGAIFTDWKKPKAAIILSGLLDGYIEPCGCAGLENQKGGLSRRMALIDSLKEKGWPLMATDLGGIVRRFGPQASIKYQVAIDAYRTLGYGVIGLGAHDLQLPSEAILAQLGQDGDSPFVSANVSSIFDEDFGLTRRYRILETDGVRIGITQVLGKKFAADIQNNDYEYVPPSTALKPVLQSLETEQCDLRILLANTTVEEARTLGEKFTDFDFVVVAGDSDPPPPQPERLDGGAELIELGHKGMYVGVLGLYEKPASTRYQRVPLDGRFPDAPAIGRLLTAYQDQLKTQGLAGLGLRAAVHPTGRRYVGSASCADCHSEAFEIWEATPHAHATATLVELPLPRPFDPECLSCHVTGWEPQEYYPFASGYQDLESTPHLTGNGCENCHGGGAAHVAAENGDVDVDEAEVERLREQMRVSLAAAKQNVCVRCHDLDNSPDFDFETYWPQVEHYEN
ncbi:MAG: multiheme c-type cytochrome [Pirellulales bacterium]|nr:multiheme c-type cytochrome [Pirellulales bacterium]